jgi:hypothetical protein
MGGKRLPFGFFKEHRAGDIWGLAAKHGQVINPPGNDHVNGQARGKPINGFQLAIFDLAAAFNPTLCNSFSNSSITKVSR